MTVEREPARPARATAPGMGAPGAPPFRLPGEHFAAALFFLVVGALGLVWSAPQLAAGTHLAPRAVAAAHLFTLGWITTSIMGALYQFLPVALGEPIRSVRVAHASFALYAPGLALFVGALALGAHGWMLAGGAAFGTGVLLFAGNLGVTLKRARRRDVTWWALVWADVFLVVTLVLGLALAGNLRWGYLGTGRYGAVGTHLHVALAGWVLLVMVGVAHRLLPMFLLSHGADERWARRAVAAIATGAGMLALLHHLPPLISRWVPALLIALGVIAFLVQARQFYVHRVRRALDPGMRLAAGGLALLGAGLALAGPVLLLGASPRLATAYVTVVILGISTFVAAHYYKIVPFLVWFHRFGPLAGKRAVPRVAELYDARTAYVAGALLLAGAAAFAGAVALGQGAAARAGASLFLLGTLVLAAQMLTLSRRRP